MTATTKTKAAPAKKSVASPKASKTATPEIAKLRIKVSAYEHKVLDMSVRQIVDTAVRYDGVVNGPVPLPTEIRSTQSTEAPSSTRTRASNLR